MCPAIPPLFKKKIMDTYKFENIRKEAFDNAQTEEERFAYRRGMLSVINKVEDWLSNEAINRAITDNDSDYKTSVSNEIIGFNNCRKYIIEQIQELLK